MTIISLTTGTAFIMWLGEQISERGIGNGMSLIIFAGIVVGLPNAIVEHLPARVHDPRLGAHHADHPDRDDDRGGRRSSSWWSAASAGFRCSTPSAWSGRRVMGGQSTHMPLKVNAGGVIPVIFASSILAFPQTAGADPAGSRTCLAFATS